jgi:hypothetical protein
LSCNSKVSEELGKSREIIIFNFNKFRQLKKTLAEDFNYLIIPIAFDIDFKLDSNGCAIDKVY